MGYSIYPPAASGITVDDLITVPNWEQIAYSNTPNTATITFSSISTEWKKLRIVAKGIYNSLNGDYDAYIRFNGDSGNNYAVLERFHSSAATTSYPLYPIGYEGNANLIKLRRGTASNAYNGNRGSQWDIEIDNLNTTMKTVSGYVSLMDQNAYATFTEVKSHWKSSSSTTITSITFTNAGSNFAAANDRWNLFVWGEIMATLKAEVIDVSTGEKIIRDLTAEELAQRDLDIANASSEESVTE